MTASSHDGDRFGAPPLAMALAGIDAANAADPTLIATPSGKQPAALAYGRRMSEMLARHCPAASEALQIAARAQHIERWKLPRTDYPEGRAGYHRWRNEQKQRHAQAAGAIMAASGCPDAMIGRVQSLLRKEYLRQDVEAQALEDVACLVFLQYHLGDFAASKDEGKLEGIIAKTWAKMSPSAHAVATTLPLDDKMLALIRRALAAV